MVSALKVLVRFLDARQVEQVRVEFGYILDRDLAGKQQASDEIVPLKDLEDFINVGPQDGTIEWNRSSDFRFYPLGTELAFLLCNDADLHVASAGSGLLHRISANAPLKRSKGLRFGRARLNWAPQS